ncbi:MAG TPA: type II secretion system F family protein [Stellaceae bacterium]|nr:type II secretion system F family protein [Stellaceae bacterium]
MSQLFASLLDSLLTGDTGIALLGGVGVFVTLIALGRAFVPSDPMAARIKSHQQRRQHLLQQFLNPIDGSGGQKASVNAMRGLVERLKLTRGAEARQTSDKLAQAGWRSRDMLVIYLGARLIMPFVAGGGALLLVTMMGATLSTMSSILVAGAGVLLGGYSPVLFLKNAVSRRYTLLKRQIPDGLDLMVICAEAGLSLDASLTRVARELGGAAPELADEVGLTAIELGFLPNRRTALNNLVRRADIPAIRAVVNTLMQTERYGTPLAHSLRVLAAEFRDERMMKAEEKAARLPAIMTVPMILFILPALFIVLIGPAIIQVLDTFK